MAYGEGEVPLIRVPRTAPPIQEDGGVQARMRAAVVPLVVVHMTPEGYLEAMVNTPPNGLPMLFQGADHIANLNTTLETAIELLRSIRESLPMTASADGSIPQ
jgi:hypothetical protein